MLACLLPSGTTVRCSVGMDRGFWDIRSSADKPSEGCLRCTFEAERLTSSADCAGAASISSCS